MFYILIALTCSLLSAGSTIASKLLVTTIPVFALAFLRYGLASLSLFPYVLISKEKHTLNVRTLAALIFLGFMLVFLFSYFFFSALQYSSATSVTLIAATNPILTMCVSACIKRSVPTMNQLASFMLSFIGAGLVITEGKMGWGVLTCGAGELLMLAAVCCQIVYALTLKRLSAHFSPVFLAYATGLSGVLFVLPLVLNKTFFNLVMNLTYAQWAALGFISVFGTALDLMLYSMSIKYMGPERTNLILFSSTPVFVFILAALILGETICMWQIAGGILIVASLVLGLRDTR